MVKKDIIWNLFGDQYEGSNKMDMPKPKAAIHFSFTTRDKPSRN